MAKAKTFTPDEKKIEALVWYKYFRGDAGKTAKQTGLPAQSITRWAKDYNIGGKVSEEYDYNKENDGDVVALVKASQVEAQETAMDFIRTVVGARDLAARCLHDRIIGEKDALKLANILKILVEIQSAQKGDLPGNHKNTGIYQMIEQQIINIKHNENAANTNKGDTLLWDQAQHE